MDDWAEVRASGAEVALTVARGGDDTAAADARTVEDVDDEGDGDAMGAGATDEEAILRDATDRVEVAGAA